MMQKRNPGYIEGETFKRVIENTPLVSVDLIVRDETSVLLGKRVNRPAKGFWFTLGGRVLKGEKIDEAIKRIARAELGMELTSAPKFIGVFEHLYDDAIFEHVSTHYLNLGYEVELSNLETLPKDQHDEYRWFEIEELLASDKVHAYVKDYFTTERGSVPQ